MTQDDDPEQGSAPAQNNTSVVAFDEPYAAPALEDMRKAVKGNGVKSENVRLESVSGENLSFAATTTLKIQSRISEKITVGRITGPQKVDSPKDMRDAVEKHRRETFENADKIKQIKDTALAREDRGFALATDTRLNLDFLKKDFVFFESCALCRAKGTLMCQRCDGKGHEICPRCNGNGVDFCPLCNGNGNIQGQDGKYQPCHRCRGERKIACSLCQQRRKIQCSVCKTKGSTTCGQCNGQGWKSLISIVEIEAITSFDYARDAVPEKIRAQIDKLGSALSQYAIIAPEAVAEEVPGENIVIQYQVSLPYAEAGILLNESKIDILLMGAQGKIVESPDFVEDIIRAGAEKLSAAAAGRGPTENLLREAAKYRTLRGAIMAASKYGKTKAVKAVMHNNPLGLSWQSAQQFVNDADKALHHITGRPRITGMILGAILMALVCGLYFFSPLREILTARIPDASLHLAVDALAITLGAGLGYAFAEHWKGQAKKSSLEKLLGVTSAGKAKSRKP